VRIAVCRRRCINDANEHAVFHLTRFLTNIATTAPFMLTARPSRNVMVSLFVPFLACGIRIAFWLKRLKGTPAGSGLPRLPPLPGKKRSLEHLAVSPIVLNKPRRGPLGGKPRMSPRNWPRRQPGRVVVEIVEICGAFGDRMELWVMWEISLFRGFRGMGQSSYFAVFVVL
jgi:hypothetical protein